MDDTPLIIKIVQKLHNSGETVYVGLGKLHYYLQKITEEQDDPLFGGHNWKLHFVCPGIGSTAKRFNELNADRWTITKRDNAGSLEWEMQEDRGLDEDLDDDREPILTTILRQRMKKGEQVLYRPIDDAFAPQDHRRTKTLELKEIKRHGEGTEDARTAFNFEQIKTGRYHGLTIPDSLMHLWDIRGDHTQWELYRIEDDTGQSSRSRVKEELDEEVDDERIPLVATLLLQLYEKRKPISIDMGFHGFIGDITYIEEKSDGLNITYKSTTQGWLPVQKFSFNGMDYCFTLVKKYDNWCFTYTPEFLADLEKQRREKR